MARNLNSKHKICRSYGVKLCDSYKCPIVKRNYPPGQHGQRKTRIKLSDYGRQLREKQKAKYIYGLLERQFHITFKRAQQLSGNTGTNLLLLLEKRLDNVVFRAGFATTKRLARQLVNHGHFNVNGKNVDIPSYTVRVGDVIAVKGIKQKHAYWKNTEEAMKKVTAPDWLAVDKSGMSVRIAAEPSEAELPQIIEPHLIVEYYSR